MASPSPRAAAAIARLRVADSGIRRVLVVSSGHAWSTLDAYSGLVSGFRAAGFEVATYDLHTRIDAARDWLEFAANKYGSGDGAQITEDDVIYQAGIRSVVKALEFRADAVVIVCAMLYHPSLYILLERAGLPVFVFGTESPYDDEMFSIPAKLATAASVNDTQSLGPVSAAVRAAGESTPVSYLPLGFNPSVHYPGLAERLEAERGQTVPAHDVVFIGNLYPSRAEWLSAIDWGGIDLALYGVFDTLPDDHSLRQYIRGGVVRNYAATAIQQRAKVVINLFRTEQFGPGWTVTGHRPGASISPRLIECAASGACVVSEYRAELVETFGDAMPLARTPDEMSAAIRRLLSSEPERAAIRAALPPLVAGFDYAERARQIVDQLEHALLRERLT